MQRTCKATYMHTPPPHAHTQIHQIKTHACTNTAEITKVSCLLADLEQCVNGLEPLCIGSMEAVDE